MPNTENQPLPLNGKAQANENKSPKKNTKEESEARPVIFKIEAYLKKRYELRHNLIADRIECHFKGEAQFTELNENDMYVQLLKNGFRFSKQLLDSLLKSSFVRKYDPFQDYFARLPSWNMERDYIFELAGYVKAADQLRFNLHFKKALVRSIACALGYGFNKQAFILMGKQNDGKSTFIRFLCPPTLKEYIKENIAPDREGRISLTQNFLINLDELATLSKYEINQIKNLFSLDRPKERKVYGRKDEIMIRRATFWGSTNRTEFLTDETGSVRWLCFEIREIDFSYLQKVDINKVYAQAYYLLNHGFDYTVSALEMNQNEKVNQSYQVSTDEMNLIMDYYLPGTVEDHDVFYTSTHLLIELIEKTGKQLNLKSGNISKALEFLGFKRESGRSESYSSPRYGYYIKFTHFYHNPTLNQNHTL